MIEGCLMGTLGPGTSFRFIRGDAGVWFHQSVCFYFYVLLFHATCSEGIFVTKSQLGVFLLFFFMVEGSFCNKEESGFYFVDNPSHETLYKSPRPSLWKGLRYLNKQKVSHFSFLLLLICLQLKNPKILKQVQVFTQFNGCDGCHSLPLRLKVYSPFFYLLLLIYIYI